MQFMKDLIPSFLWNKLAIIYSMRYGWFGDYKSWDDALKDSHGYDDDIIFNKTKESIHKVICGDYVYERDTVVFDRIELEYHQAVLVGLLKFSLLSKQDTLTILDFGGSLGHFILQ